MLGKSPLIAKKKKENLIWENKEKKKKKIHNPTSKITNHC